MERRAIAIRGTVQGVGFRPFVYRLASEMGLHGVVCNNQSGVCVEVEGHAETLDRFLTDLTRRAPALARIDQLQWTVGVPRGERGFRIAQSGADDGPVTISPDAATCDACLAELFDPANRRFRYPFLNCTDCGPRLTIIRSAPYDRSRTTMAAFEMCPSCRAEYEDPADRRFHAQPTACAVCGPRLRTADNHGQAVDTPDPLQWMIALIRTGGIGAVKGLGGYHLVCLAGDAGAVGRLRARKHRDQKPFAVMVEHLEAAATLCKVAPAERGLLASPRRPIVLLAKQASADVCEAVAPGCPALGVMLPSTPLHHLLLRDIRLPVVMTSGNRSDEPIAISEPEVFESLAGIADGFLIHERPIHVRCDDSVTRVMEGGKGEEWRESPIRRSRGDAPQPLQLPHACVSPVLAVGGQLKGTFALGDGGRAIVSHHLGDLDHLEAYRAFERDIELYQELFVIRPQWIAHDMHPDYASTRYAQERASRDGASLIPVQHHHAHMASCMAEHHLDREVIGVIFDGTGYGTDGTIWGGEFLVGDLHAFRRAAHLRYVPLPGGDRAIREPWRVALAYLRDAGMNCPALRRRLDPSALRTVEQILDKRLHAPVTSSAGRLFDAVASLLGVCDAVTFEGQAAMQLEYLAATAEGDEGYVLNGECLPAAAAFEAQAIDTRPLTGAVVDDLRAGVATAVIARRFHMTLADIIGETCLRLREITGLSEVVLSGGVFMNAILSQETVRRLKELDFSAFIHHRVPANDGGLSLGQLAIAACRIGDLSCA